MTAETQVETGRLSRRRFLQRAGIVGAGALAMHTLPGALAPVAAGNLPATRHERLEDGLSRGVQPQAAGEVARSAPVETPIPFDTVGFELPDGATHRFRTSVDGVEWSEWTEVASQEALGEAPDDDAAEGADGRWRNNSPAVWVGEARHLQIEGPDPAAVVPHLIDSSGLSEPAAARAVGALLGGGLAGVASAQSAGAPYWTRIPRVISRAEWGANESWRRGNPSIASFVNFGVLHHTVTSNTYSTSQAAAQVRSIYSWHTQGNGWNDIGYNFLVDRFGRIFEGRYGGIDRGVVGAHAAGFNTGSTGVAMLGTFSSVIPPAAAQDALMELLAWKYRLHGTPPTGSVRVSSGGSTVEIPRLCGHRDVGQTECPGNALYPLLGGFRQRLADTMRTAQANRNRTCEPDGNPAGGPVVRVSGRSRFSTASAVAAAYWESASTALVANGRDFPDALAGAPLAAREGAPILLTNPDRLHGNVANSLERLGVSRVILLGGLVALAPAVEQEVRALGITNVERIGGDNRFTTAGLIARRAGIGSNREAALVLGEHPDPTRAWPDAVAAGAFAALGNRVPVLLTQAHRLPSETQDALRDLNAQTVLLVGGYSAIETAVANRLQQLGYRVRRLAGRNRYGTSVEVARFVRSRIGGSRTPLVFASGADFPDALTAGPVAARRRCPILLAPTCGLDGELATGAYLALGEDYDTGMIIGGTAAVSDRVRWQANQVVG